MFKCAFETKRNDYIILAAIVLSSLLLIGIFYFPKDTDNLYVEIKTPKDNITLDYTKLVNENKDMEYELSGKEGTVKVVYTKDKGMAVIESSCPDKVCVHTGYICKNNQSIICVPNEIAIRITGGEGDIDAYTR